MSATRTIIIGNVLTPYYVRARNCGFPGGYLIFWQGKKDFSQPTDFLTWAELLAAIKHRLALAGLGVLEEPEKPKLYRTTPLPVMVVRLHRKLRKRAYESKTQTSPVSAPRQSGVTAEIKIGGEVEPDAGPAGGQAVAAAV